MLSGGRQEPLLPTCMVSFTPRFVSLALTEDQIRVERDSSLAAPGHESRCLLFRLLVTHGLEDYTPGSMSENTNYPRRLLVVFE